ncbi:hypothetical protein BWX39_05175 [Prevotella intermedia ATCC 25611 = DSM 20706]|uniref:hypothetical protein n=1 Tax=Prevotella intermedia TaxID=28131 RepID=UPI000417361E|nr:hypothetical protein [Prevotella intermedia]APW32079.1 hypothetical protein BWX39_05175 [Prevotella intermedia ATCC 25611 = DSM 20706]SUB95031.1 Uncharacterised protein [Prevotella intermedia]
MANLEQLKKDLLADGIIDSEEVKTIKAVLYEDGKIDKDEADFLFELNDAVSGKENAPEWKDLFVDAITAFVLEDEVSPNEIDEDEAEYLYNRIKGDDQVDDIERALLENIKAKAKSFPEKLASLL